MRFRACRLPLAACLAMASVAGSALAGASIVEPYASSSSPHGLEASAWAALSAPTDVAGGVYDQGFKLGLSVTQMATPSFGIGFDIGYSRWPSARAGNAWDQFYTELSGGAPIFGSKVTLTGLQAGLHLRAVPVPRSFITPWIQLGGGLARMHDRVQPPPRDQLEAAGLEGWGATMDEFFTAPVLSAGIGFDIRQSEEVKFGLEARYEWIHDSSTSLPFTSLTIAAHARFGDWGGW